MANNYFQFKKFTIYQDRCAFKVGTDGVLLGASAEVTGVRRILDIGAGTGVISIMLAQRSEAMIVAIEPDRESFLQMSDNAKNSPWSSRITVCNVDLQNYANDEKFDLIVTNPPYFSDSVRNPDPRKSVARHNDNLPGDVLLEGISRLLTDEGRFQLIMPYAEGNVFIAEASAYGFYCNSILKIKPLPSSEIRRLVLSFSRQKLKPTEKFLTIEHGKRHEFTGEYVSLMKDFYLKF